MISVEDAVQKIFDNIRKELDEGDRIKITDAYGRVLIDDVFSSYNLPPFRASIKDGYAVLASDGKGRRKVLCAVKAGASVSCINRRHVPMMQKIKATCRKNIFFRTLKLILFLELVYV